MTVVYVLYALAIPGAPALDCGMRKCVLGEFPSRFMCERVALNSEEYHDKTLVLRCLKEERSDAK